MRFKNCSITKIIFIILFTPVLVNIIITSNNPITNIKIAGNETHWIGFWGGYIGAILGAMVTLYVLKRQLKQNQVENKANRAANEKQTKENRNLQLRILHYQQETQKLDKFREIATRYINVFNYDDLIVAVNNLSYHCYEINSEEDLNKCLFQLKNNAEQVYLQTRDIMQRVSDAMPAIKLQTMDPESELLSSLTAESDRFYLIARDIHTVSNCISNGNKTINLNNVIQSNNSITNELKVLLLATNKSSYSLVIQLKNTVTALRNRYKTDNKIRENISDAFIKFIKEEEVKLIKSLNNHIELHEN